MSAKSTAQESGQRRSGQDDAQTASYVYGVFPADITLNSDLTGVGDPPGKIRIVRSEDVAALVSTVHLDRPLGTPEDLKAHQQILDACASEVPVLPIRFGAVLTDDDGVTTDLLEPNHDEFVAALQQLDGTAEFVVKGRYDENAVLADVLARNREAEQLQKEIQGADPDATRNQRIRLGEIINDGVAACREADTRVLGDRMTGHCVESVVREPSHELDAVNVAFLLKSDQDDEFRDVLDELAHDWHGRVELRLLGPMAAYDFVVTADAAGGG